MNIDLLYKDLTYRIIGGLFEVYNELGYGYQEKHYQKATAQIFRKKNIIFKEQVGASINFQGEKIGGYYLDFLIENKIILELKKGNNFRRKNIEQVHAYLKKFNLKLGILADFTKEGVKIKRIINIRE